MQKLEAKLKDLGYLKGPTDSFFDARTAKAVVEHKQDQGWKPRAVVVDRMSRKLGIGSKAPPQTGP